MTIRKGEEWGSVGPIPADVHRIHNNAELHALVNRCRSLGAPIPTIGLLGGDLMRAAGGTGELGRLDGGASALVPIDLVRVVATDGGSRRTGWFAAHLVARGSWWRGPVLAAMNAQHRGRWDVAPRSHPNDGRVDVVEAAATMSIRHRWAARGRLVQGTHVPHPAITVGRHETLTRTYERPLRLWLDGVEWGRATSIELVVEPDAFIACV